MKLRPSERQHPTNPLILAAWDIAHTLPNELSSSIRSTLNGIPISKRERNAMLPWWKQHFHSVDVLPEIGIHLKAE